jgi:hypothetical protein
MRGKRSQKGIRISVMKDGKDYSTSHHIMNGLKWMRIVLAILTLIAVMIAVVLDMSVWEMFF